MSVEQVQLWAVAMQVQHDIMEVQRQAAERAAALNVLLRQAHELQAGAAQHMTDVLDGVSSQLQHLQDGCEEEMTEVGALGGRVG